MTSRLNGSRTIPRVFWVLAVIAIVIWSQVPSYVVGWDLQVYENALLSQRAGHDPYADGIAVQRVFHSQLALHPNTSTPFTYVYSPMTLPLLRLIGLLPLGVSGTLYWLVYAAGLIAAIWVGMQAVEEREKPIFALLAPVVVFFPGLLQNDVLFSGNVAYILYGLVLSAAVVGWRRGNWMWFYAAVLAASCCKAPLLYLLAVPVLSARKQWLPAVLTGVLGCALFAMQPHVWPTLFQHYLEAVELQFSFNRDFSSSPAGLLANALYYVVPYKITSAVFYLFYAILFSGILLYLSRKYLAGHLSLKQWLPVMLVGVFLLNPRIMEYDIAPITVPMALIAWRFFARGKTLGKTVLGMSLFFAVINAFAAYAWRPAACFTLVGLFLAGAWSLWLQVRDGKDANAGFTPAPMVAGA
jgi:hypothetical protein